MRQFILYFIFRSFALQQTGHSFEVAFLAKLDKFFVHFFHLLSDLNLKVFNCFFDKVFELGFLCIHAWEDRCEFILRYFVRCKILKIVLADLNLWDAEKLLHVLVKQTDLLRELSNNLLKITVAHIIYQSLPLVSQQPLRSILIILQLRTFLFSNRPLLFQNFHLVLHLPELRHDLRKLDILIFQILLKLLKLRIHLNLDVFIRFFKFNDRWHRCQQMEFFLNIVHIFNCFIYLVLRVLFRLLYSQNALVQNVLDAVPDRLFVLFNCQIYGVFVSLVEIYNPLFSDALLYHLFAVLDAPEDLALVVVDFTAEHDLGFGDVLPVLVHLKLKTVDVFP